MNADETKEFTLTEKEARHLTTALREYEGQDGADETVIHKLRERIEAAFDQLHLE